MRHPIILATLLLSAPWAAAQEVPRVLLSIDDPAPGRPGWSISGISSLATNGVGGWAARLRVTKGGVSENHIVGGSASMPPTLLRSARSHSGYDQDFEVDSRLLPIGLDDLGRVAYGSRIAPSGAGNLNWDGIWVENRLVHNGHLHGGGFPAVGGITRTGVPYWYRSNKLWMGSPAQVVVDPSLVLGMPHNLRDLDPTLSAVAPLGQHSIVSSKVSPIFNRAYVIVDGAQVEAGGVPLLPYSGQSVPPEAGGLPGEIWTYVRQVGINDSGNWALRISLFPHQDVIVVDGQIRLRDFDTVDGHPIRVHSWTDFALDPQGRLVLHTYDSGNVPGLYRRGRRVFRQGDPVDFDGDGQADPYALASLLLPGTEPMSVGSDGSILFTGWIEIAGMPGPLRKSLMLLPAP